MSTALVIDKGLTLLLMWMQHRQQASVSADEIRDLRSQWVGLTPREVAIELRDRQREISKLIDEEIARIEQEI